MVKHLKEAKKQLDKKLSNFEHKRDEQGRVVVDMMIMDDSNFLSPFSKDKVPVISPDVATFIENRTSSVLPKEKLVLNIHGKSISKTESNVYKTAIEEYYTQKYVQNERDIRRNNIFSLVLALFGIITLVVLGVFEPMLNFIWKEVLDIVAWVFLWESADICFLQNSLLRHKRRKYLSFITMEIDFDTEA